jgi:hypothetical protein
MEWLNWYEPFVSSNPYRGEVVATYKSRVLLNFIATVHPRYSCIATYLVS